MAVLQEALEGRKFYTVTEVALALRVSKMTVYRLVKNGELGAIRVGRSFRVREDSLMSYVKGHTGVSDGSSVHA